MDDKIKARVKIILDEESTYAEIKDSIDIFYKKFSEITQITGKLKKAEPGLILPSGEMLSPQTAAGSILDYIKTTKFLRGIKKAIDFQLHTLKKDKIKVMYISPGPFASLIFPLIPIYKETELEINIIDVHSISIDAVSKIIKTHELKNYFDEILTIDPITYQNPKLKQFDIIIIDTIQKALFKEPQVAITSHFAKLLDDKGVLIPEEIKVTTALADLPTELAFSSSKWTNFWLNIKRKNALNNRILLNTLFLLDKNINKNYKLTDLPKNQLVLPSAEVKNKIGRMKNLILLTEIKIFDDVILSEEDETGTTKLYFDRDVPSVKEGNKINIYYQFGPQPSFKILVEDKI